MTVRSIFLFAPAESARADRGPAAYAISLAQQCKARLTVLCVALDVTSPGTGADALAKANDIAQAASHAGVDCQIITDHSHAIGIPEVVAEHARMHDLCVSGVGHFGLINERQIAESLLFASGRPLLVVPAAHTVPYAAGPVAAGWDNTAQAARALGDAIALLDVGSVRLVTITGEKALPTDMDPDDLVSALARRGVAGECQLADLCGRPIGAALVEEAERVGAGLLVMGGFAHSRLRQLILGGATAQLLDAPRMPTLLSH